MELGRKQTNKQTNEGYRTTMRKVYLLPITPKEFLVVIWLNSEEWKAESTFQIISSIHKFIMKMQQILGSHYLTGHTHPKTNESTFIFLEFVPACKKSVHSICLFFRYSRFWILVTIQATSIFDHDHPKKI